MKSWKSRLRHTTLLTAVLIATASPACAGSGSITYDMDYISTFGGPGNGNGQFNVAAQVTGGPDGKIYVADRSNNRVQVFDRDGAYLAQFTGTGGFNNAIGVEFASDGNILVSSGGTGTVQIFDPNTYSYIGEFGTPGGGPGELSAPHMLTIDAAGNIYIAEYSNNRVSVFDSNYNFITSFNSSFAVSVAVSSDNKVYVSSETAQSVRIYDASNGYAFLGYLAQGGNNPGEVSGPEQIYIDAKGDIYVAEYGGNRIQLFDKNGNSYFVYDASGSSLGSFNRPNGIFAATDGRIYVSEWDGSRVHILQFISTETFTGSPPGGDETAATALSNLVLQNGGVFADDFIGYHDADISGTSWELSGTNDFSGAVTVSATDFTNSGALSGDYIIVTSNALVNNGSMSGSTIAVDAVTTVTGTGSYIGELVMDGVFNPGANAGDIITTTITGNYLHGANAIYVVDADDAGHSDMIDASGTADLQGGEVQVFAANGNYAANTNYTILTAGGGVTGTFNSVTSNLAFLTPTLVYTNPNAVILNLVNQNASTGITDFAPYASGSNQAGVANALTEYSASQFGGDTATYNTVSAFNTSEAAQLVKEVTPDEVASIPQVQSAMVTSMQTPLFSRMNTLNPVKSDAQSYALYSPAELKSAITPDQVWLEAVGGFSSQQANNGAAGYRLGTTGMRGGIDKVIDNNNLLGLSVGHARGNVDYKSSFDKSAVQYTHVDLYGKHHSTRRNLVLEGIIGTGGGRIDSTRPITAGGLGFVATGNTNAYDVTGSIKLSNPIALQASTLIPNITGTMSWQRQNGFTETGAGPFNLNYDTTKATPITITPMINWQKTITSKNDTFSITPDLGIGATWQPNELDRSINAQFSNATGTQGFNVTGARQKPLSLNVTAAVTMIPFTENAAIPNLTAATTIQTNSTTTNGTATINAKWVW